jgi:CBS domain-containing protein
MTFDPQKRFAETLFPCRGVCGTGERVKARVPVMEIMTSAPVTVGPDATVWDAAGLMRDRDVGSLVVLRNGEPAGIVTERDIVKKVAAEDAKPSEVRVADIMSSPVITVHPHEEVVEAAKRMADRKIRRLVVVDDNDFVGVVTENDILKLWPSLIEVTREFDRAGLLAARGTMEGYCESCGAFSTLLAVENDLLLCPECREG